jgi:hypothetical protein
MLRLPYIRVKVAPIVQAMDKLHSEQVVGWEWTILYWARAFLVALT